MYVAFLKTLNEVLHEVPEEDSVVLLGDFNAHVGNDESTRGDVIGRHGPPELNTNGRLLLKFCYRHKLSITNTKFKHKRMYTWSRPTQNQRSMIDFVIVSSALKRHVVDTQVKKWAELSTDHRLVVSRIRQWGTLEEPGKPKLLLLLEPSTFLY